jgi:hypothetical protein
MASKSDKPWTSRTALAGAAIGSAAVAAALLFAWQQWTVRDRERDACFRPFIEHLAVSSLSPKTIRRHVDNLWLLGGEIIRDLNFDPSLRRLSADRLLSKVIHEDGGPLLYNGSEDEQRSFDATCRKLRRFRTQPEP